MSLSASELPFGFQPHWIFLIGAVSQSTFFKSDKLLNVSKAYNNPVKTFHAEYCSRRIFDTAS